MDNYERTIDLMHVFNFLKYNLKKIVITTLVFALLGVGLVTVKNIILPSEKLYYSTAKILFKFDSWSTSEKDYSLQDWDLNGVEKQKYDSNGAFYNNSKLIFTTDKIMRSLMERYKIDGGLDDFKENIMVENVSGTDFVRIIVTASTPEIAEEMLTTIILEGIKSVENLYELKYEIMDKYTYTDNPFSKLKFDSDGDIEVSSNIISSVKMIILMLVVGFVTSGMYFVLKCIFNNKVEDIEYIEKGLEVPVLQVLSKKTSDYNFVSTKLINNNKKRIVFIGVSKNEGIGKDIVGIAKTLLSKNKKPLIVCVDSQNSAITLGCELHNTINTCEGVDLVSATINNFKDVLYNYEKEYDFILIEANSAEESSDSLLLSKNVESTVLVNKCNTVSYDEFRRVVNDLNIYANGVTGVILKDVTKDSSSYKYVK